MVKPEYSDRLATHTGLEKQETHTELWSNENVLAKEDVVLISITKIAQKCTEVSAKRSDAN
jgi:hypothetical protein